MEIKRKNSLLFSTIMATGMAFVSLAGSEVVAQEDDDTIVVTGSRIPRKDIDAVSPLTVVDNEEFKLQGAVRVEDLTNSLPQVLAAQGTSVSNGATGTAQLDIRGIGAGRSLTILNGRRLPPGSPQSEAVDINQIPASLIKTVEVITGGASAVYGADAVGGVANFIIDDEFDGFRIDLNYSFYQHSNTGDNPSAVETAKRGETNPSQFFLPDDNQTDGFTKDVTVSFGTSLDDGRGHITGYVGYKHEDAVWQASRDFSACALQFSGTDYSCGGSSTSYPGRFSSFGALDDGLNHNFTLDLANPGQILPWSAEYQFNYNPYNYYQRPGERWTAGFFAQYDVNDMAEVYSEFMFMNYYTVAQIAPSGYFAVQDTLNCDHPLMPEAAYQEICVRQGLDRELNADGTPKRAVAYFLRRNFEGGFRQDRLEHTSFRAVLGVRGDINENMSYDIFANNGRVTFAQNYVNELHVPRAVRALDAVRDEDGNVVCRSVVNGTDPNCVVYNLFDPTQLTQEALDYISGVGFTSGQTEMNQIVASVSGLTDFAVPSASETVAYAVGVEYRSTYVDQYADDNFSQGSLAGQGGATNDIQGGYDLYELFGETRIPLVQDKAGFEDLTLELGVRYSDYSLGFNTTAYKAGLEWAINDSFKLRTALQRAVRSPTVFDLYLPQRNGLWTSSFTSSGVAAADPCGGDSPAYTLEQCLRTGITADQYGRIVSNGAGQYNSLIGGNENLDPETSDTFTLGGVFTPSFVDGLTLQFDYFSIEVTDTISSLNPNTTIKKCAVDNVAFYCSLINRAPGTGSLWLGETGFVFANNINLGSLTVTGVDVNFDYGFDLGEHSVKLNLLGTMMDSYEIINIPGEEAIKCVGFYAGNCGRPRPEWKHKARATFVPGNADNYQVSLGWRYIGDTIAANGEEPLDTQNYFDLTGSYSLNDKSTLVVGVNNILDSEPPLSSVVSDVDGNGNTYPQIYDALGRLVHMSLRLEF